MKTFMKINENDNVAVALKELAAGTKIAIESGCEESSMLATGAEGIIKVFLLLLQFSLYDYLFLTSSAAGCRARRGLSGLCLDVRASDTRPLLASRAGSICLAPPRFFVSLQSAASRHRLPCPCSRCRN